MQPRRLFLLLALTCLATTALEAGVLTSTTTHAADNKYVWSVSRGGGYFAMAQPFAPSQHIYGTWSAAFAGMPDRVLLVAGTDVERILAGQPPQQVYATFAPRTPGYAAGSVDFRMPDFRCGGPRGACREGDLPTLVWTRGHAWEGTPRSQLQVHEMEYQGDHGVGGDGPVLFRAQAVWPPTVVATAWLGWLAAASAAATLAAGAWWAWSARRTPPPAPAPPSQTTGTEEMLRLVTVSELYVATIARYFLVSAAVIVALLGLTLFLALPPVLAAAETRFGQSDLQGLLEAWLVLAVLLGGAVAFTFWGAQYRTVRRELKRWREVAARFHAASEGILA